MKKYTIIAVAVAALLVIWGIWSATQQGGRAGEMGLCLGQCHRSEGRRAPPGSLGPAGLARLLW